MKGKSHHHLPFASLSDAMQHCMKGAELIVLICFISLERRCMLLFWMKIASLLSGLTPKQYAALFPELL
jgi:hypothetical protein